MSYLSEFPDYDGKLYIPKGFEDASYHNDIMPRAEKMIIIPGFANVSDTEVSFILWQDYVNPDKREYDDGKRYIFLIEVNGDVVFEYCSDDLDNVKELIKNCVK